MKVSYRGIHKELPPKLQEKVDAKFAKLSKLLERRGEKEAHVVITTERHLHHAEITLQFYDHKLVCMGTDADLFTALSSSLEKLEKQAVKQRTKMREKGRRSDISEPAEVAAAPEDDKGDQTQPARRVFHVNHNNGHKPMTLDEALMEMESDQDYVVYQDADKQCMSVLVRRRDGHFDLIEP